MREGFAFVKNVAIDQHLLQRNRQFDLVEIIRAKPQLLGIGLDEDTAIIVQGNDFSIIGPGYVAIHDHGLWQKNKHQDVFRPFFLLRAGDQFNIKTRKSDLGKRQRARESHFLVYTRSNFTG